VKVPRRIETGEAPGWQGATMENIGNIRRRSNAAGWDASSVECSGTFTTGSQGLTGMNTPTVCPANVTTMGSVGTFMRSRAAGGNGQEPRMPRRTPRPGTAPASECVAGRVPR